MDEIKRVLFASDMCWTPEVQPDPRYMQVKMRMMSTRVNRNHVRVTEAFIDDIIGHADEYVGMPLCVDLDSLKRWGLSDLGHMQDEDTGQFLTAMIGSFVGFEKVHDEYGASLIGVARIPKRTPEVVEIIEAMYRQGRQKFSFEILAEEQTKELDGEQEVICVDAAQGNKLLAMAIVTTPAYPEAGALALVAEAKDGTAAPKWGRVDEGLEDVAAQAAEALARALQDAGEAPGIVGLYLTQGQMHYFDLSRRALCWAEYKIEDGAITVTGYHTTRHSDEGGEQEMDGVKKTLVETAETQAPAVTAESAIALNTAENQSAAAASDIPATVATAEIGVMPPCPAADRPPEGAVETIARLTEIIEHLRDEVNMLRPYQEKVERMEQEEHEQKLQQKKDELTAYAKEHGLDTEDADVAQDIAELNYEGIFARIRKHESEAQAPVVTSAYHGISTGNVRYGGLLERA